jgi:DNA-binding XRE family transcriptional regulator
MMSGQDGDAAAVQAFLENPEETFPDSVVDAILGGESPIKVFREYRGMTQEALARAAHTNPVYISQIERSGIVGAKTLAKIAKALNVDSDLLTRS